MAEYVAGITTKANSGYWPAALCRQPQFFGIHRGIEFGFILLGWLVAKAPSLRKTTGGFGATDV